MTNPFRTDLITIFIRRGHKGKEIVEEVKEIEALLDGQRCEWTEKGHYAETECGRKVAIRWFNIGIQTAAFPFCPCCGKRISIIEVKDGQ